MTISYPFSSEIRLTNGASLESDIWSVGQIYPMYKNIGEGIAYDVDSSGLRLSFLYHHPSSIEIEDFHNSKPQFALVEDSGIQFFMSKFGRITWNNSAKNYSLSMTEKLESASNMLTCLMFDTSTGKLVGMRVLGLHQEFVDRVVDGVNKQLDNPLSFDEFSKKVRDVYLKYPTDNKLLKRAHCKYDFATGRIR